MPKLNPTCTLAPCFVLCPYNFVLGVARRYDKSEAMPAATTQAETKAAAKSSHPRTRADRR